jgi:hypothetical protein
MNAGTGVEINYQLQEMSFHVMMAEYSAIKVIEGSHSNGCENPKYSSKGERR